MPGLIRQWEPKLGVVVAGYFLQRMKTKWGGCDHRARTIRLNTELAKKPKDLLEYVVVHEYHLIVPTHNEQFLTLLSKHYPSWREARAELNEPARWVRRYGTVGGVRLYHLRRSRLEEAGPLHSLGRVPRRGSGDAAAYAVHLAG